MSSKVAPSHHKIPFRFYLKTLGLLILFLAVIYVASSIKQKGLSPQFLQVIGLPKKTQTEPASPEKQRLRRAKVLKRAPQPSKTPSSSQDH